MATTMTLQQLQTAVVQRADMVNSQFIDQTIGGELTSYVNQSYFELYDLLVTRYGDNYFVQVPYQFTTNGTDIQYPLPADFYKLLGVDLIVGGSTFTLKPFNFGERNNGYINNNQAPSAGQVIQMWYIPRWTPLVNANDTVDGISGWLEYVIIDAAIKCLQKEESDVTVLGLQKAGIIARIEANAANRDAGSPATVQDVQNNGYYPGRLYCAYNRDIKYRINNNSLWLNVNASSYDYYGGY